MLPASASATATMMTTSTLSSFGMSETGKYGGLVEQTYYRKVRNNLFQLIHYVYSVSPRWLPMHAIISILRLIQFLGPALVLGYDSLWTRGQTITRMMEIVGVLFHLVPASYRHDAYIPILALYCALNVLSWGLIIGASFYYKTNAKLPNIVPSLVTLYLGSFGYLLHPIACQHAFEMLSEIISGKDQTNLVAKIILFVLFIAFFIAQSWFFIVVTSVSLEFRPGSLTAMLFSPQVMMFMFTGVITAVTAVGTFLGKYPQIALLAVTAVLYLVAGCLVFHDGGFISMAHKVLYLTCSISGMVMLIINIVMLVLKRDIDAMIILIELAIMIVAVFISYVIIARFITKCLMELDYIADDESYFERYQSPKHVITMLIIGCQKAHPVCMELRIFEMAVTQFPHSVKIWAVYLKFVAIFPEQNASITLILQRIRANRLKGAVIKNLIEQSYTLLRLRDSNLSPELKRKLGDLGKKVQQTKHKIRHIWDMVIQGNVNEMEGSISRANSSVEMCIAEYAHVLHQYSNNRFLVRSYTRFNNEVLADHAAASEWFEKSRLLQRGIQTSPDNAHELGLLAMPLLPVSLSEVGGQPGKLSMTETDTSFATDNFDIDEDANQQLIQQTSSINECIKNLSIPAVRCTNIMRIVWLIVLFLIPLICLTVYIDFLITDLTSPLDFIYTLSYLRCLGFQVAVIGHRYVLENIPNGIAPHINRSDIRDPPVALGSTHDPAAQLSYLIKVGTKMIETLTTFSAFKAGDRTMDLARESVFGENMPYKFFKSRESVETVQVSLQVGMMDVFSQLSFMLEYEVITPENPSPAMPLTEDILDTSMILNSVQNAETFGNYITDALTLVVDYIVAKDKSTRMTMIIILCLFCIGFSAVLWISTIVELKMIKSNKLTVYRCLTSLPKNTVSTVAEDLRVLKKDKDHSTTKSSDPEAELNKQEESILKMLATSGDSSGVSTNIAFLVLNAFHMIAMIVAYAFFLTMVMNQSQNLVNEAPHVDYLLGAYTYDAGIVLATDLMLGEFYNLSTAFEISVLNTRFNQRLRTSQTYYARLLYGDPDEDIEPFQAFAAGLESAINRISCQEQNTIPESVYEAYECFRPDIMFYLHHNMVLSIVVPVQNGGKDIKKENPFLPEIYDLSIVNLYENFFYPMFSEAIPALVASFNGATAPAIAIGFSMFVVAAIAEGIFISLNLKIQRELLFALRLLLHCPAQVVLQNGKIMNVLTGDFSKTRFETTSRSIQFFDDVVDQLPNACLILEPDARVFSVNQSGCRLFNKEATEIRNEDVRTLLGSATCDKLNNLSSLTKQVDQRITLANSDGTDSFFNASLVPTQGKIVMTLTDITQQIRYNTLIQEERAKSDKLLSSILPADLVHRVQAGEKDISFSVQSASVMFVDIVEFTPWCASNTGAMVMSTLNALFKEFDSRLSKYSTLTKIKCIGDCYMAAGGIFSEVNQPTVHATEMVDFGLSVIEAVGVINKNLGLTLRVRAGVNTGGPVVAGVLGVGKPTFEILGPTINMAQQMEHHGVPMQVHISRPVYEYIYGSKFTIKERGNIEVKNGTVQTYLVSGKQKKKPMRRSKLISFKIDANLDRMWRAMGLTEVDKQDEIQRLEERLVESYRSYIAEVAQVFEEARNELRECQAEYRKQQRVFGDSTHELPVYSQYPIRQQIALTKQATADLVQIYEERIEEFEDLQEELKELFDELGVEDRGEFAEVGTENLSVERLQRFRNMVRTLSGDKDKRIEVFESLRTRIEGLLTEMREDVSDDIRQIMDGRNITNDSIKILNETLDLLEELRAERVAQMDELNEEIERLYTALAVDPSDRMKKPTELTQAAIDTLRSEVEFMKEQKETRLPQVIKGLNAEIAKLCEQMKIPARMRPKYKVNKGTPEEEAAFLRQQLDQLRQKQIAAQPIMSIISQIEACKQILAGKAPTGGDQGRPGNRRFVEEEREKKKAKEQLPKLERKLLTLLVEFREKNGYDFEFNGINYSKEYNADAASETMRRQRKETIGQQLLIQMINESKAGGNRELVTRRQGSVLRKRQPFI